MNRIDILNSLIKKNKYKTYLEIGVQAGHCFSAIDCEEKTGVDPDPSSAATVHSTSDDFFAQLPDYVKFDLIFIDGLHHADQVIKDISNSFKHLSINGIVVMHDCIPTNEFMQLIPMQSDHCEWTGDTWKAFVYYRQTEPNLTMCVVDTDWGTGILKPGNQKLLDVGNTPLNYENFVKHKYDWMNIISVGDFIKRFLV